jgi:hypothetical protein
MALVRNMRPVLALFLALLQPTAAGPVSLTPAEAAAVARDIEGRRAEAERALRTSPTSYLATVARYEFGERTRLTVGRAPDNDVRLDDDGVRPHHLEIRVDGDRFAVRATEASATFRVEDIERREATLDPTSIGVGRFVLRLSHQRFPAIIVFDPSSPRLREYKGLKFFPVDLALRYELALTPNATPETVVIMSTRGTPRRAERVGWFDFSVGGTVCRLEATRLLEPGVGEQAVSVYFRDATSGDDTYPLGRYIDAERLPDGRYLLDFNLAYNPLCAFSEHYNCPIPPKANTLPVPIRAGEMDAKYH